MSDGVEITVLGDTEMVAALREKADLFDQVMQRRMHEIVGAVQRNVVDNHLSGPTGEHSLSRIRGNLARSVQTDVGSDGDAVQGRIFYTGDVPYAAIHEFGGVIPAHDIVPVNAQALHFMMGGKEVFAKIVHLPDITMPERAPLRTGFRELADWIVQSIKAGMAEVLAS